MAAYYNEIDPYAAQWLRNLIAAGHIVPGDVDERSIVDVQPDDLKGYTQAHFFAGIGGWSYAARLAGFPDDRQLWTGSCPCQPFSVAGKGGAQADERHLWPVLFKLIAACQPPVIMGEQVAAAVGKDWLDGVSSDLEGIGYACGAAVVPACAVNSPHRRDRLWFVADNAMRGRGSGECEMASTSKLPRTHRGRSGLIFMADANEPCAREEREQRGWKLCRARSDPWARHGWITGSDGKARRIEPSIRLLAHGVPARVGKLRAYGNAIVPQVAAEVIGAYMEAA